MKQAVGDEVVCDSDKPAYKDYYDSRNSGPK